MMSKFEKMVVESMTRRGFFRNMAGAVATANKVLSGDATPNLPEPAEAADSVYHVNHVHGQLLAMSEKFKMLHQRPDIYYGMPEMYGAFHPKAQNLFHSIRGENYTSDVFLRNWLKTWHSPESAALRAENEKYKSVLAKEIPNFLHRMGGEGISTSPGGLLNSYMHRHIPEQTRQHLLDNMGDHEFDRWMDYHVEGSLSGDPEDSFTKQIVARHDRFLQSDYFKQESERMKKSFEASKDEPEIRQPVQSFSRVMSGKTASGYNYQYRRRITK